MEPKVVLAISFFTLLTLTPVRGSETTDFVVVGGGTAGCAVAARLCEYLPHSQVTLLERAPPRDSNAEFLIRAPRNGFAAWVSPAVSETFLSAPNPALNGKKIPIITGNTLGGSSAINGMQWTIPNRGTVESWGIGGLSTRSARKFFNRAFRKVGFAVQKPPLKQIYARDMVRATAANDFKENRAPFKGKVDNSVWENFVAVDARGRRVDSCTAYLSPALTGKCAKNLKLIQGATVTQLRFAGRKKHLKVVGVEYVDSSDRQRQYPKTLLARREVILSAGPYGSPKLLQLSGIGPRNVLEKNGIEVKVPLGVGTKTQLRPLGFVVSLYPGVPIEPANDEKLVNSPVLRAKWEKGLGGVLGKSIGATNGRKGREYYFATGTILAESEGLGSPLLSSGCLPNPTSFGKLEIADSNPFSPPSVLPNLLTKERETQRLANCIRKLGAIHSSFPAEFAIMNQTAMGADVTADFVRENVVSGHHFVGGCPVGSVLKRNLRVRGVNRLRVVDASAFSTLPESAGPQASVYMLAEFASSKIAQEWRGS